MVLRRTVESGIIDIGQSSGLNEDGAFELFEQLVKFGSEGDESLSVRVNRHLRLGEDKEREL